MPSKPLPTFGNLDKWADGLHPAGSEPAYGQRDSELDLPEDDAARLPRGLSGEHDTAGRRTSNTVPIPGMPVVFMSIPTRAFDAPLNGQTWTSGDKGENWMGGGSYPTTNSGTEASKAPALPRDKKRRGEL